MISIDYIVDEIFRDKLKKLESILDCDVLSYYGLIDNIVLPKFRDMVESIASAEEKRESLAILLTTLGGDALAADIMVNIVRRHYGEVNFIVPDYAYSAGTIFCMSGDNIYMDYYSALGPIDPQVKNSEGKWVPALGYLDKIQELLNKAAGSTLSRAEFLILKDFDLAEIRMYEQARDLATDLIKKWLVKYKFKNWHTRNSTGEPVDDAYKEKRAEDIAKALGDNKKWLSHGRAIDINKLDEMGLKIEDFGKCDELKESVRDYSAYLWDYISKYREMTFIATREEVVKWT